jgi:hypothetical protein
VAGEVREKDEELSRREQVRAVAFSWATTVRENESQTERGGNKKEFLKAVWFLRLQ